ncbi:SET domain-containing protein 9 [Spea bombifrons]|uniref:SET domain-containing protein 9 n=1 Tax=Spea bombifrons TaxID=233779 RepID=UPI00234B3CCB|nr:SET domain-containing protein 9 [Spea bombifrons]
MRSPGFLLRSVLRRWKSYKYRFVPWVALNMARNRRTLRYVSEGCADKVIPDTDVYSALLKLFRALFIYNIRQQTDLLNVLPEATKSIYQPPVMENLKPFARAEDSETLLKSDEILYDNLGFCVVRRPSSLNAAGTGVFVSRGLVREGAVVSMYPGTVYQKYEPIFFQSIGNPFIFRCLDGILIDGNDKGISKSVYRSCSRRDQLGPLKLCDTSWLTASLYNPLAVGQYINNCSNECAANVCYQEFDVPQCFPVELRQYIPNINYSHNSEGLLRCVVLVAIRDIDCGEELFSNYFTLVR